MHVLVVEQERHVLRKCAAFLKDSFLDRLDARDSRVHRHSRTTEDHKLPIDQVLANGGRGIGNGYGRDRHSLPRTLGDLRHIDPDASLERFCRSIDEGKGCLKPRRAWGMASRAARRRLEVGPGRAR